MRFLIRAGVVVIAVLVLAVAYLRSLPLDVVAIGDALDALAAIAPRASQVVELRFFGGMTNEEVASVLGVSEATVYREWRLAKAWLARELGGS